VPDALARHEPLMDRVQLGDPTHAMAEKVAPKQKWSGVVEAVGIR
jgi:hypothetical protein